MHEQTKIDVIIIFSIKLNARSSLVSFRQTLRSNLNPKQNFSKPPTENLGFKELYPQPNLLNLWIILWHALNCKLHEKYLNTVKAAFNWIVSFWVIARLVVFTLKNILPILFTGDLNICTEEKNNFCEFNINLPINWLGIYPNFLKFRLDESTIHSRQRAAWYIVYI